MRAAGAGAAALLAYWLPSVAVVSAPARRRLGVHARIAADDAVALTFDDGPHPDGTPAALATLAARGARATFFLVGEQVERRPELAREVAAAGHEIALHCHRHRNLMRLAPAQVRDDLARAEVAIADATGVAPRRYRPPYGILTAPALRLAHRAGWEVVLWTRDGHDWQARATAQSIAVRLVERVRGGDVLLLHDADWYSAPGSWRRTAGALPRALDELEARGLRVAPLDRLRP